MKKYIILGISLFISLLSSAFTPELKTIKLRDGDTVTTRLCLPDGPVHTIVIALHGTGTHTYLNKRDGFNFYDELAEGFCKEGVAFFTYNRRGVTVGGKSPMYVVVDSVKYAKYLPLTEAGDIECMITGLKKDKRFRHCKILLYGLSEGTITASLVAERKKVQVDGLLLHGYAHENMYDIIKWQNEGHGIMIMANAIFDKNGDGSIDRREYDSENATVMAYRKYLFQNQAFDSLDVVKDEVIDVKDIGLMRKPLHDTLMKKIETGDGQWISRNYFPNLYPAWFKAHFSLEANKTRLLRIDIPIFIFHGTDDANVPVESINDIRTRFRLCNKTNLTVNILPKHDHDLNFRDRLLKKEWSEGYKAIFRCAAGF